MGVIRFPRAMSRSTLTPFAGSCRISPDWPAILSSVNPSLAAMTINQLHRFLTLTLQDEKEARAMLAVGNVVLRSRGV
jgi:hypothetical protein